MSNVSAPTGKPLIAVLVGHGVDVICIKGSYHCLRHADGRTTVVPVHSGEALGVGLLASILRDVQASGGDRQNLLGLLMPGLNYPVRSARANLAA